MWIEKVTVNYTRTINLGDYNNIKLSMMPTVHLDPDDNTGEVLKAVWAQCRANVEHAAQPIVEGYNVGDIHGITTEELILGLPVELQRVVKENDNAD